MDPLKVAMVNTEITRGGAARMAVGLADSLNGLHNNEINITLYHSEDRFHHSNIIGLKRQGSRQLNALLARFGGSFTVCDIGMADEIIKRVKDCDILHVHNLHGYYLNFEKLFIAWKDRPVVWTWHDMWGATGRCGFAFDCEKWKTGCSRCPKLSTYPAAWVDKAYREFIKKSDLYGQMKNLTIVCPSEWMANIAVKRGFDAKIVNVIPNPVNIDKFKFIPKKEAIAKLNLTSDKFTVLFIASDCNDSRKGYGDFVKMMYGQPWQAIAVGKPPAKLGPQIHHAGIIKDQKTINLYYAAADVMVLPTYADNYPNTVIESLVSGTPVIGYDEGGVASQLDLKGCSVVKKGDWRVVSNLLRNKMNKTDEMSYNLALKAIKRWEPMVIAEAYSALYQKVLI